jgi:hypothetical protein
MDELETYALIFAVFVRCSERREEACGVQRFNEEEVAQRVNITESIVGYSRHDLSPAQWLYRVARCPSPAGSARSLLEAYMALPVPPEEECIFGGYFSIHSPMKARTLPRLAGLSGGASRLQPVCFYTLRGS